MGSAALVTLSCVICVLAQCSGSANSELVPVYMWETSKSNAVVPAIGHVNRATFKEVLLQKIEKYHPLIVVFAEPTLSPEDFTEQDRKTFEHIAETAATSRVSYLPLVESPIEVIRSLPNEKHAEVSITTLLKTNKLPESRILIVNLNDAKDEEDRIDMLTRHDSVIIEIYKKLVEEHKDVLAILTGFRSSWIVPEQIVNNVGRKILAEQPNSSHVNNGDFLIYIGNKGVVFKYIKENGVVKEEISDSFSLSSMVWDSETTIATIKTTSKDLIMEFQINNGYWLLVNVTYDSVKYKIGKNIYAPTGFSFHCSDQVFVSDGADAIYLRLPELQMQLQTNVSKFDDAYDCVGFTTIPIWSGLFITFILVLIMTAGLTMMMDIKTMDRFDDPKGKTIIINAVE